jgi:hypothetical protein
MMHKEIKVYMDDMIAKSRERENYLWFMVSSQSIEVDLIKEKQFRPCLLLKQKIKNKNKRVLRSFELHCSVYISNDTNL